MAEAEGSILPLEVLFKIFSYLEIQEIEASVAPVCRLWRDASRLPDLRRRLTLTDKIATSAAHEMLRRSPLLTELKIHSYRHFSYTDDLLRTAATHYLKLRVLTIYGDVSDIGLEAVAQCSQLRSLSLLGDIFPCRITDHGLLHLKGLRHLEKLQLIRLVHVTAAGWRRLFSICEWPHLRELSLALCNKVQDEMPQVQFERLHTTLRSIELSGYVSFIDLVAVAQCDHLRALSLNGVLGVTDDGLMLLLRLRHLEKITLRCPKVTRGGLGRLFSMCEWPHLRQLSLRLDHADTEGRQVTFDRLHTTLRSLELDGRVSDFDLEAVAQCDQLRTLSLNDYFKFTSCDISDDGVVHLARLRQLEKLILWGAFRVTAAGWRRLFSMCEWPNLRQLRLPFGLLGKSDRDDLQRQAKLLCPDVSFY